MLTIFLLISAFIAPSYAADSCNAAPISIPIQDTQVLDDVEDSYMIGLRAKVGTPLQDILMLPWAELNNTWIYDYQPYCDDTIIRTDEICKVRRGNYFYENDSSTYVEKASIQAALGATQETDLSGAETGIPDLIAESLTGDEVIDIGGLANVTSFPIGIPRLNWDHGYTTLHAIGLGQNSTLLNSLVQGGQIASHVWSIFWGRMWVDDWLDGSVVLGGYDSSLTTGANYSQPLDYTDEDGTGCWTGMKVTITGIELNFLNGTDVNIYDDALPTCLVPQRQLLLEGPSTIRESFENATGMVYQSISYGLHWSAAQYLAEGAYEGDMTITLKSGLSVRVPNSQFLTPFVDIADNGSRIYNESIKEFLYDSIGDQSPTLGRYFLTAAYLMVDHDDETFTLWQANATTESNLVSIVSDTTESSCNSTQSGSSGTDGTGSSSSSSSNGSDSSTGGKSSTGAIAGGVVGGVIALAAIAAGVFLVMRRRKRRGQIPPSELTGSKPPQELSAFMQKDAQGGVGGLGSDGGFGTPTTATTATVDGSEATTMVGTNGYPVQEKWSDQRYEMGFTEPRVEMPGHETQPGYSEIHEMYGHGPTTEVYEMDGTAHGSYGHDG